MSINHLTHRLIIIIKNIKFNRPLTTFDITIFLRQFATLLSAGIPIIQCCEMLEKSEAKQKLRLLSYSIKRDLLSGKQLSTCISMYGKYFNVLTCELIKIGEMTGKLDEMLLTVAHYQEKNLRLQKKIRQTCFYPCILAVTTLSITLGLFIFIMPRFAELFREMEDKLPLLTRSLFYFSAKLNQFFLIISVGFCIVFIAFRKYYSPLTIYLSKYFLNLPFIKTCMHKIRLMRFARNLAITFSAGIPIVEALKLAGSGCKDKSFTAEFAQLRNKISSGQTLHHAMRQLTLFPLLMVQMVKVGEESGMLDAMLDKIADFFESETDLFIEKCSQLLEPLIMIVQGVLIGVIVIGMYLPIFKLGNTF